MKIQSLILKNFRRYRDRTVVDFNNLTALIGKNDVGKSTILEALDIFFEGGATKFDHGDASAHGDQSDVQIGVVFGDLPTQLDIDAGAVTTLQADHLLNEDGNLEIIKSFNCTKSTLTPKVFARALHPSAQGVSDLLSKKNADLKRMVKEAGVENNCHLNNNPTMRQALYGTVDDLALRLQEVPLKDGGAKDLWEAIKRHLPVYALFRSDRVSSDQDPEVQDPMKLAIKSALAELNDDLNEITGRVERFAKETADRTIEQLKSSFPDLDIASVLKPQFRPPKWDSVFKLDLESDDQIPLNKRGSGIRRLVLLSFFQAEASRKQREKNEQATGGGVPVIYAIEEPETSQHPDSQERIVRALQELSDGGDQIILTTHVPGLAGLLPTKSLCFIDTDPGTNLVRVQNGSSEVYEAIAETLGVLPDAVDRPNLRVAVAVEGPTDIDALISFGITLNNAGHVQGFSAEQVFWTIGGGETLKDWIERRYLDRIGLPQVFLMDSDRTSAVVPASMTKQQRAEEVNTRENCQAFLMKKRTIENYVHPDAISRVSASQIAFDNAIDMDFGEVAAAFKTAFEQAKERLGRNFDFQPTNHDGAPLGLGTNKTKCKKIITSFIMRHMTPEEILERGAYGDAESGENEILDWLNAICQHCTPEPQPRIRQI